MNGIHAFFIEFYESGGKEFLRLFHVLTHHKTIRLRVEDALHKIAE